ncbi:MAG: RluA family pseudouridine synthase [Thermoleophilaceae bacterium]|nr:RluA family pseudouridine synthase [Thermoleophilaceae bacterium]
MRLDTALATLPEVASRAQAQRLIEQGSVEVEGESRRKRDRVAAGERIVVRVASRLPDDAPVAEFDVVLEDEHLMVVDKPAGVVVHPGAGNLSGTLAQALAGRAAGGPPERAGIVHRLDRDTSGLLIVAKSEVAHGALTRMLRARKIEREYLALVHGRPGAERGTVDAPLGRDSRQRTAVSTRTDRPRQAVTHFWTVEELPHATLLGVRLETGRTHQIRAHLAAIGHPVCGDARYGGEAAGRVLGLTRQFLHSSNLRFAHPLIGEDVVCESKPPADLRRSLDAARRDPVSEGPDGG